MKRKNLLAQAEPADQYAGGGGRMVVSTYDKEQKLYKNEQAIAYRKIIK
jgi:hypothetical protein